MAFNTITYLVFLPVCIALVFIVPKKFKNLFLLLASFVFYLSAGHPLYILFMIFSAFITFFSAKAMENSTVNKRKILFWLTIFFEVALLCFFKYSNVLFPTLAKFLAENNLFYTVTTNKLTSLIAPLGISYYTFATIGYLCDVMKNKVKSENNFIKFCLFVSFFPHITAGPIPRAAELLPQLNGSYSFDYSRSTNAFRRMLFGFFKKIAVADMLSLYIGTVYSDLRSYTGITLFIVPILYIIWLYCDFSGYSDIAIASAQLIGIDLGENFKTPLFSSSIREFWRRWHISLSSWLKDYIYIPLGGSRCQKPRHYLNLIITFLISGVWHGAGITFVIWGALQAFYQCIETFFNDLAKKNTTKNNLQNANATALFSQNHIMKTFKTVLTFFASIYSFVFFALPTVSQSFYAICGGFSNWNITSFVSEFTKAISSSFNSMPILITFYALFCALSLLIVIVFDALSYFKYSDLHFCKIIERTTTCKRWVIYFMLLAFISAAFIMQNGNYVGNISFAYANF